MTERLADISARIDGIRQLGSVVNAMKGIAAARASGARAQVLAVDSYAATIAAAMGQVVGPDLAAPEDLVGPERRRTGLLVFCAEQGFAGAFSERVLDSAGADLLIGTRGASIAAARGLEPHWTDAMPSHTAGIPKLADRITHAIQGDVAEGRIDRLDVISTAWMFGRPKVTRQGLFPLDLSEFPSAEGDLPLTQVPRATLIDSLGQDYVHALVCKAALHAFAAENEARMEAMTAAGSQIARELETLHDSGDQESDHQQQQESHSAHHPAHALHHLIMHHHVPAPCFSLA